MGSCKAVIFDMDGVILDSERVVLECWKEIGKEFRIHHVRETFVRCVGTTMVRTREIFREAYGEDFPMDEFDQKVRALFMERFTRILPVKAGAREILEALSQTGVALALASSTPLARIRRELEIADLLRFFPQIVAGDMVQNSKPDPEIFLKAGALCGARPEETWVIEDSYNGIRAARAAGMHPIMVPDMLPPNAEMEEKAEIILPDLLAARDYLLEKIG